jgi:hypothetical protein
MVLVVRVKVGPMMLAAGFDEHPNDNAKESRELRHSHTLASSIVVVAVPVGLRK